MLIGRHHRAKYIEGRLGHAKRQGPGCVITLLSNGNPALEEDILGDPKDVTAARVRVNPSQSVEGSSLSYVGSCSALCTSAVIVTYNSVQDIDGCLSTLESDSGGLFIEIIVVDNASADDTCTIVTRHPAVQLIRNAVNRGFAAAVNRGFGSTSGDYVLVLNPDVVVNTEAILALIETLDMHEEYAAVGCRMVFPNGYPQTSARDFPTVATFLRRVVVTNNMADKLHRWREVANGWSVAPGCSSPLREVNWILGGCMMIRRSAYTAIGPLDEAYFLYYEDIDWCYRAHLQGWKIGFLPNTCVIHDYKRSSSKISFTNRLMWVHLASACRFFGKFATTRGVKTIF
jgi:GT2 family glycosyltransferase